MPRFDVHRDNKGWLVDVQSDLTAGLPTRVVIPLLPAANAPIASEINPVFTIDDDRFALMTELLAAVPRRALGRVRHSLAHERDAITRALDLLFTGF
jgi:toxin CcdB